MYMLLKFKTATALGVIMLALLSGPLHAPSHAAEEETKIQQNDQEVQPTLFERIKAFFTGETNSEENKDAAPSEETESSLENTHVTASNSKPPSASELKAIRPPKTDNVHKSSYDPAMSRILDDATRI